MSESTPLENARWFLYQSAMSCHQGARFLWYSWLFLWQHLTDCAKQSAAVRGLTRTGTLLRELLSFSYRSRHLLLAAVCLCAGETCCYSNQPLKLCAPVSTALREPVGNKSTRQSANDTGRDESRNLKVWIEVAQDMLKSMVCGLVGGVIGALIYLYALMPNARTERRGRPSASVLPTDVPRPRSLQ